MAKFTFNRFKFVRKVIRDILSSDDEKINLEEYCFKKLKETHRELSPLEIGEMIPSIVDKVSNKFKVMIENSRKRGITPEYDFIEYPPNTLYKTYLLEENGFSSIRKHRKEILQTICKMKPRSFEFVCEHLLNVNKIFISGLTSGKKEGGVDFYGLLELNKFSNGLLFRNVKIKIIGQAKRYKIAVDDGEVRKFKTHYDDLLQNRGRAIPKLPDWFINLKAPILPLFIITCNFRKGAKIYAKENGIILKEGEEVVEDLIKSPKAKEWFSRKNGKIIFDKMLFMKSFEKNNVR